MRTDPSDPNWPRLLGLAVHELRTPISVGSGYLRMLLTSADGTLTDGQRKFITESQKAWGRMTTLAEEMSELSHLEAGTLRFDRKSIDLRDVLADAIKGLPAPEDTVVEVTLSTRGSAGHVTGDATRLRTAFTSLLLALRRELVTSPHLFVEEGTRAFEGRPVSWVAVGDAERLPGLASAGPAELTTFDEWRGGSGLKLAIARRIVEAHDGRVWSPADGTKAGAVIVIPRHVA